jgi:hypothetical protein
MKERQEPQLLFGRWRGFALHLLKLILQGA